MSYWHDETIEPGEETRIKKKHLKEIKELAKKTRFNRREVECLVLIYFKLKRESDKQSGLIGGMTDSQLKIVLHAGLDMTDCSLIDRVIACLDMKEGQKRSLSSLEKWVMAMSLFMRGSLEEKIEFCFLVYNLTGDGLIGRDSVFTLLKKSLVSSGSDDDAEESVKDMIEVIMKKMDLDRDGKISFNDFRKTVLNQPVILECFGPCLPSKMAVLALVTTLFPPGHNIKF